MFELSNYIQNFKINEIYFLFSIYFRIQVTTAGSILKQHDQHEPKPMDAIRIIECNTNRIGVIEFSIYIKKIRIN